MYPHIKTTKALTVVISNLPHAITTDHQNFERILEIARNGTVTEANNAELLELIKPIEKFNRIFGDADSNFQMVEGTLKCFIDNEEFPLDSSLYSEILEIYNESGDLKPLYNFVVKLAKNPRREVINELWGFISACGLAITESGNFLAYKNVRKDFKDAYTGTMDNSPGQTLEMPRWKVEHNPNVTCAAGLHFAAWGYLQHYASGGKTVILSISPEDVVSIPTDYNNMKGRACKYTILREVASPEELKTRTVFTDNGDTTTGWTKTNGQKPRLQDDTLVEVKYRNGDVEDGEVEDFIWEVETDDTDEYDIISYRLV